MWTVALIWGINAVLSLLHRENLCKLFNGVSVGCHCNGVLSEILLRTLESVIP